MPRVSWKHQRRVIQALFIAVVILASSPISAEDYDDEYDYEYEEYESDESNVLGPSAESVHDQALEIANGGDLKRALPLFQKAVDLDPMRETFQSNLGYVRR
jgi:nitrate reductase beta subunit